MLQRKAMLANLNISQWTARKHDKTVSAQVETANAAKDAGRYNKQLVAKELLAEISKIGGRMRDFHYANTLPWGDNGDRLLPSTRFLEYTAAIRTFSDEFHSAVARFVQAYPAEVQAARVRLGNMYNPDDYPDVSRIAKRFDVSTSFMPVPDASDFRVDVTAEDAAIIKEQITATVRARQHGATRELWNRLLNGVEAMYAKLVDPDAIFRDSLVENLRELSDLIPKLNISGDEELASVCRSIRHTLLVHPDTLRHDLRTRVSTAATANLIRAQIVDQMEKVLETGESLVTAL